MLEEKLVCGRQIRYQNMLDGALMEVVEELPRCQMTGFLWKTLQHAQRLTGYFWLHTKSRAISPKLPSDTCPN